MCAQRTVRMQHTSASRRSRSMPWTAIALAAGGSVAGGLTLALADTVHAESPAKKTMPAPAPLPTLPDISALDSKVLDDPNVPMRDRMATYVKLLQRRIVQAISDEEQDGCSDSADRREHGDLATKRPKSFVVESWTRKEGGEGISCVIQDGKVFEKGGVNVSVVYGNLPPSAIRQMSPDHDELIHRTGYKIEGPDAEVDGLPFFATGISLVIHPRNPYAPTSHANFRYFELGHPEKLKNGEPNPRYNPKEPITWWFGGGADLTPMYLYPEDAQHFHKELKRAADAHDPAFYAAWKPWCDHYFRIAHRDESRGVGGLFFDDIKLPVWSRSKQSFIPLYDGTPKNDRQLVSSKPHSSETLLQAVRSIGDAFVPAYVPLVHRRKNTPYDDQNEIWKQLRRGRYAEFNLVYDRGTKFGLFTPSARIESIMMSLPLHARWEYMQGNSGTGRWGSVAAANSLQDCLKECSKEETAAREEIQDALERPREWV